MSDPREQELVNTIAERIEILSRVDMNRFSFVEAQILPLIQRHCALLVARATRDAQEESQRLAEALVPFAQYAQCEDATTGHAAPDEIPVIISNTYPVKKTVTVTNALARRLLEARIETAAECERRVHAEMLKPFDERAYDMPCTEYRVELQVQLAALDAQEEPQ